MKIRLIPTVLSAACVLYVTGCGTLLECEEENIRLQAEVDSLQMMTNDYSARMGALAERVTALEKENLTLDDRARQLSARLAEVSTLPINTQEPMTARLPNPQTRTAKSVRQQTEQPVKDQEVPQSVAMPSNLTLYNSSAPADEGFLSAYQAALNEFNRRQFTSALQSFQNLLAASQPNDMTDNCVYWIGECHFALGSHHEAIDRFSAVIGMKGSDKIDDALMMRGNAYLQLKDKVQAKRDFTRLLSEYPSSEFADRARQKLRQLK